MALLSLARMREFLFSCRVDDDDDDDDEDDECRMNDGIADDDDDDGATNASTRCGCCAAYNNSIK